MRRFLLAGLLLALLPLAFAHVGYVTTEEEMAASGGADALYLLSPFTDPLSLWLIIGTAVLLPLLIFFARKLRPVQRLVEHITIHSQRYDGFIAWMLRLSLGIMLIGSGAAGALITPSISGTSLLSTLQILLGFFILAGFLLPIAVVGALALYILALVTDPYALGNLDVFAIGISLLILGDALPGVDDLFGLDFFPGWKALKRYVPLILRVGIGGAMAYLAIYEKLLNPHLSGLVVEKYALTSVVPVSIPLWVLGAGLVELALGLALIFGLMTRFSAAVGFFVLSLSFFYFGEDVASHITLFGTLSVLFVTGAGPLSIDSWWKRTHG